MSARETDWTSGAPKWAAVLVLGAASAAAIGWAVGRGGESWRTPSRGAAAIPADKRAAMPVEQPAPRPIASTVPSQPIAPSETRSPVATPPNTEPPGATASLRKLINVNTAGQGELELLPGIGPALAKRIMDHRAAKGPFRRVDDLDAVKGIGPKILERLRPQVCVE